MARTAAEPRLAAKQDKSFLSSLTGGLKSYGGIAVVSALIVMALLFVLVSQLAARSTYYVLKAAVPARTQITPDMLTPVEVSKNGAPTTFLTPTQVAAGQTYSRVALAAGELITTSNAGPLQRINANLPANFVAASFKVTPDDAVGGKVRTGDYIDLIATSTGKTASAVAKTVLHHVLVLDVTVSPSSIAKSANDGTVGNKVGSNAESKALRDGIPSVYTVGLTPKDATVLAAVRDNNLMVVLSANQSTGSLNASTDVTSVFAPGSVPDSGAGTNPAQADPNAAPTAAATPTAKPTPFN